MMLSVASFSLWGSVFPSQILLGNAMGTEYQLTFQMDDKENVHDILRNLSYSASIHQIEGRTLFHFFDDEAEDEMPVSTIEVIPNGIYFCDYGNGNSLLEEVTNFLKEKYNDVIRVAL